MSPWIEGLKVPAGSPQSIVSPNLLGPERPSDYLDGKVCSAGLTS